MKAASQPISVKFLNKFRIAVRRVEFIDLIKEIKAMPDYKDIPIIALTAYALKRDKAKIMESGCDGYLAKPVLVDQFLSEINKFLAKSAVRS